MNIMKKVMKHATVFAAFICAVLLAGCNMTTLPSELSVETASKLVGSAAGLTVNTLKIDESVKTHVTNIVAKVSTITPSSNETFTAVWTPVYTEDVKKLVDAKKLTTEQAILVNSAMAIVCGGIDYVFDVKYPQAKTYSNLVAAAVRGFSNGLTSTIKVQSDTVAVNAELAYDHEAFESLKRKFIK